ncbi:agmatinase family protein [Phaeodactylibacter luteus]|uniref:Agmatinase family protein n=1 Tax=Phaeodactylibacter luteus TaxID=1564516 RepID=A0A5C6S4N8_9BACT|nr:agmatinase family protein [Phaeodactylibacter luteus]TXB69415.1 agmatinase family protein [Phaeodactylibacter luteus]
MTGHETRQQKIRSFDPNGVGLQNGHFIGLPFDEQEAQIVLLPVPWDVTVSYGAGTATGPANILEASPQLDLLDTDVPDAWQMGIYMRQPDAYWLEESQKLRPSASQYIDFLERNGQLADAPEMAALLAQINRRSEALNDWVEGQCESLLSAGQLVGVVGGDHSTPLGLMKALARHYPSYGVLQIDAHMDLRKAYEGFTYSHASIFYNALQIPEITQLTQVGIRDYCEAEVQLANESGRAAVFYSHAIRRQQFEGAAFKSIASQIISTLPEHVYISFDIDGLQPSLCPNTGTPVPGGLALEEAHYLLAQLVEKGHRIIGFDLCETAGLGHEWDGNVGARVLYKLANLMGASHGLHLL